MSLESLRDALLSSKALDADDMIQRITDITTGSTYTEPVVMCLRSAEAILRKYSEESHTSPGYGFLMRPQTRDAVLEWVLAACDRGLGLFEDVRKVLDSYTDRSSVVAGLTAALNAHPEPDRTIRATVSEALFYLNSSIAHGDDYRAGEDLDDAMEILQTLR